MTTNPLAMSLWRTKTALLASCILTLSACATTHKSKPNPTPIAASQQVNLSGVWERVPSSSGDKAVQYRFTQSNSSIKGLSMDGWPDADIPKNGVVLAGQLSGNSFTGKFVTLSNVGNMSLSELKNFCGSNWKLESRIELTSNAKSDRLSGYVYLPLLDPLDCKLSGKTTKAKIEFALKNQ